MWKWAMRIAAVPLALGVLAYGVGLLLPADHVAREEASFAAPPAAVAALVRNVEQQPRWRRSVERIEVAARQQGRLRYTEHSGGDAIAFDFVEEVPGARFRSSIADPELPFAGQWSIALAPEGAGTRVLIEERGTVHDPLYRFFSALVFGHHQTMRDYLADMELALARAA